MTTPKNVIPEIFILSESFPNEEGIRSYFSKMNKGAFFTQLEEKNVGKEKISPLEKTVEITGNTLGALDSQTTKNNKEYLANLKKLEQDVILDHSTITVLFNGVSNDFVNRLQSYQLCYQITRKDFENELQFWLTPAYLKNKETATFAFEIFTQFSNLRDKLRNHFGITDPRDIKRMMPCGYGTNAVVTTGLRKWQELIVKGTSFTEDPEVRFVLTNLVKVLKNRHPTLFSSLVLEGVDGKHFGLDTLKSSEDAWSKFKIISS